MANINESFAILFFIILLGYVSKRTGLVKESDGEGISRVVLNVTLPATILSALSTMTIDYSLLSIPVICAIYNLVMTGVGFIFFRKLPRKLKGMLVILIPAFNIGLFAYPLVEAIWGSEGLKYFILLDAGNALAVFGSNFIIASFYSEENARIDYSSIWKRVMNSLPFLSYFIALGINFMHIQLPPFVLDLARVIAKANMPLSLFMLGLYLSFSFGREHWQRMGQVILLRYLPGIAIGMLLFFLLPMDKMFRITLLLGFILPISMTVIPYSVEFKYDSRFVGTVNNATIIVSFVLVWLVLAGIGV